MLRRRLVPLLVAAAFALVGAPLAAGAPAAAGTHPTAVRPHSVVTVYYDASQAGDFAATADAAADIWNSSVSNVRMEPGSPADVTVNETTGGGSYTYVYGLGSGDVYIDSEQAAQYNPTRIMAHEFGHVLGLPDNYNGDCSLLMSGHSAGTSCQTTHPSAGEAAQVDANFANGVAAANTRTGVAAYRHCFRY